MASNEYDENHPDLQAHFSEAGYARPVLFDKIDPAITNEQATTAAEKVQEMMDKTGLRNVITIMTIGNRYHVGVLVDEFLNKADAPPEFVDGVYVSIDRLNSLDYWLGPKNPPSPPAP